MHCCELQLSSEFNDKPFEDERYYSDLLNTAVHYNIM